MTKTKTYKAIFLLDLRDQEKNSVEWASLLQDAIKKSGGLPGNPIEHGHRQLARTPKKDFQMGTYVEISFDGQPHTPNALQEDLRLEKAVNRIFIERVS